MLEWNNIYYEDKNNIEPEQSSIGFEYRIKIRIYTTIDSTVI